jgi:hypothetical protein
MGSVTTRALAAVSTALVLALSACGGGGDGDGAAAPAEADPKEAYVEQASEVCSAADEEFTALGGTPTTPEAFGPYVQKTVDIAGRAQTELAALTPPEADRADLEAKVLTPFAELVEQSRAWSEQVTAAGTDQAALLGLLASRPTSAGVDKAYLQDYGLTACADAISRAG